MPWQGLYRGPDWTDVTLAANIIKHTYGVHLAFLMLPVGGPVSAELHVSVVAEWKHLGLLEDTVTVAQHASFPNQQSTTLPGLMFRLLHQIEYDIDREQKKQGLRRKDAARASLTDPVDATCTKVQVENT